MAILDVAAAPTAATPSRSVNQADMRTHNLGLALRCVREHPGCSRSDLARATGLTKPAVTKLVGELMRYGLVRPLERQESGRPGRPADGLGLAGDHLRGIGIELRLDHVRAIVTDLHGHCLGDARLPLERHPAPRSAAAKVGRVVRAARDQAGRPQIFGMGMAIGAGMDPAGKIALESSWLGWTNVPIHDLILAELHDAELHDDELDDLGSLTIEHAALVSGLATSRAVGCGDNGTLVHLEVGGGAGMGIVVDGRITEPPRNGAIGHIPMRVSGSLCACGQRGCLDTLVGFGALLRATGGDPERITEINYDEYAREVGARADAGDRRAAQAIDRIGTEIGRAISIILALSNPDKITIGGYPLELGPRLFRATRAELARRTMPRLSAPREVEATPLGANGAVLGAAALALDPVFRDPVSTFERVPA